MKLSDKQKTGLKIAGSVVLVAGVSALSYYIGKKTGLKLTEKVTKMQ